jgi:translocation and assembly module TamB
MHAVGKLLRWIGVALASLVFIMVVGFGLLQTQLGKAWLATKIAQGVGDPDFTVAIDGLGGIVPFRMSVERIEIGDRDGIYLTLRDVGLDISPAALLAGRAHIRSLSIADIDMARPSSAPSTTPLTDYLKVPHLPVGVVLDTLLIGRLALAPPILGESVIATVQGSAEVTGATAHVSLDLHRIDGSAGNILLAMELAGNKPDLNLQLDAAEPTGVLLDRLLGRTDRLPVALTVSGAGPLADWRGRLGASAGTLARFDTDVTLAVVADTVLGLSGTAAVARLLPAELSPMVGDRVAFSLRARLNDRVVVDALSIETAAGTLAGDAAFGGPEKAVSTHLRADVPELLRFAGILGQPLEGSAVVGVSVTGTENRPQLELKFSGRGVRLGPSGAEHVETDVRATPTGTLDEPSTRIEFAAKGRVEGIVIPEGVAVPPELGRDIDWSLVGTAARDGRSIDLSSLSAQGPGASLAGSGRLNEAGAVEGRLSLSIADLRPFSGLAGHPLAGSLDLEANAIREGAAGFKANIEGSAKELGTGFLVADALLGGSVTIAGSLERDSTGLLTVDRFAVDGAAAALSGNARFDPASSELAAALVGKLSRLKPLGTALGTEMAGSISAELNLEGPVDRLRAGSQIEAEDFTLAGTKLDRVRLTARVADLSNLSATVDGNFRAYGLDGTLALAVEQRATSELLVPHIRFAAAGGAVEGSLRLALDTGLIRGSIAGRASDLGRWSKLAGTPLGGSLEFIAGLDAQKGQALDLSASGTRLTAGATRVGRFALTARLADILRAPSGTARLSLDSVGFGAGEFASATLALDAPRPGRFAFQGDVKGKPLTMALAGEIGIEPGRNDLRLTRLTGSLGSDRLLLEQPLTLSKKGADLAFSGLALDWGPGRITGSGSVRSDALSLSLNAANLPIGSGARLAGYRNVRGTLGFATTIGGTLRTPQGRFSVDARELTLASSKQSTLKSLGVGAEGNWNGRELVLNGRVTGLEGDRIDFSGSAPLVLTPAPLGISVPPNGRLALQLRGAGRIEQLADLLPLGEDRVSGRFAADVAVGGTVASPAANGRLQISDGRYENFATGAVLTKMQADLVGNRDRFTLASFSAADNANGSLKAQGGVVLSGASGPTAELSATLANFRVAARDEAVATASGTVSIAGPLTSPKVTAPLKIDRADINLPNSLPPNVVVLKVVETNGKPGKRPPPAATDQPPAVPATLDITIDMPDNIFVRGHGLESEWRGRLTITGTSAAPVITGSLEQIRGSVDLLGKTFTLTRGTITFDGSAKLDPVLDIVAEASAEDITAQVIIGGFASAPTVTLSSTPPVPQDEILSRVLFGRGVGQITAAQGLQLAAAASTLAGGGPGVLDRLRGGLGLDWFRLGSGPSGPASSTLNPRAANSGAATGGTALSAGKYVAPGVSVGVSQGLSPPTSKVTVEIELRPHLTVQGEAGQSGGTGIGLNYNYDY